MVLMISCDIEYPTTKYVTSSSSQTIYFKLCNLQKRNFDPVILMMCNDVRKAFKVETCTVSVFFSSCI